MNPIDHLGFEDGTAGALVPQTYEHEAGSATVFTRIATNHYAGFGSLSALEMHTSEGHAGVQGLWFKLSDDLAVPIESYHDSGTRSWDIRLLPGSLATSWNALGWSAGDEVEVSLWDRDPIPAAQQVWTATLTAQDIDDEHSEGRGYVDGVAGSLDPIEFEYEPGRTTRITRFVTGIESAQLGVENPEALDGLWIDFGSDHSNVPTGWRSVAPIEAAWQRSDGVFNFSVALAECVMPWLEGEKVEVSLWDRNPNRPEQYVPSNEQIGRESIEGQGESEGRGEPRGVPDDGDRAPRC